MTALDDAVVLVKLLGHELAADPPTFASMRRYTCVKCGRAVLGGERVSYGSAKEAPCR